MKTKNNGSAGFWHTFRSRIVVESPLTHGGDSIGNEREFRTYREVRTDGTLRIVPYISGNSIRGQMRDLMALDWLAAAGLDPKKIGRPSFDMLFTGGFLESRVNLPEDVLREVRSIPGPLSLLGCAVGRRILPGAVEIGHATTDRPAAEVLEMVQCTRFDDSVRFERAAPAEGESQQMLYATECLRPGTVLEQEIRVSTLVPVLGAAARAWNLLRGQASLGGMTRAGFSRVRWESPEWEACIMKKEAKYLKAVRAAVSKIVDLVGALDAALSPGEDKDGKPRGRKQAKTRTG